MIWDLFGDKKLKQPTLSFSKMTQNDRRGGDDNAVMMGGGCSSSDTSKVGQNMSCVRGTGSR